MANSKKIEHSMLLDEKELHCLARIIQSQELGESTECLYCKYAFECREEFEKQKAAQNIELLKRIKSITGVEVFLCQEDVQSQLLLGSWMEKYPELMGQLTKLSFKEQLDILRNPDILKYGRKQEDGK